jgi:hypothetical protein
MFAKMRSRFSQVSNAHPLKWMWLGEHILTFSKLHLKPMDGQQFQI